MEGIQVQPAARLRTQKVTVGCLTQLFQTEAAQRKSEITADLPTAAVELAGAATQTILTRENVGR